MGRRIEEASGCGNKPTQKGRFGSVAKRDSRSIAEE
jgi:hypothetical protein